jgi:serine/threonine-protein kinase RIO1
MIYTPVYTKYSKCDLAGNVVNRDIDNISNFFYSDEYGDEEEDYFSNDRRDT